MTERITMLSQNPDINDILLNMLINNDRTKAIVETPDVITLINYIRELEKTIYGYTE